jgi:hypothetical protein
VVDLLPQSLLIQKLGVDPLAHVLDILVARNSAAVLRRDIGLQFLESKVGVAHSGDNFAIRLLGLLLAPGNLERRKQRQARQRRTNNGNTASARGFILIHETPLTIIIIKITAKYNFVHTKIILCIDKMQGVKLFYSYENTF